MARIDLLPPGCYTVEREIHQPIEQAWEAAISPMWQGIVLAPAAYSGKGEVEIRKGEETALELSPR